MNTFFIYTLSKQVITKSRKTLDAHLLSWFLIVFCAAFYGCGGDEIQLPDKELGGKISGQDWTSDKANAYAFSTDFKYNIKFLSTEEPGSDPCTAPSPSKPYLSAIFKPAEGSFSFSNVLIDPNQVRVEIHPSPSSSFIVTSGFMEIYAIDNGQMFGYIQAILDESNTLEGAFVVRFCN